MNRVLATVAFLTLAAFIGILVWNVPRLDLAMVSLFALGLAFYDFFLAPNRLR